MEDLSVLTLKFLGNFTADWDGKPLGNFRSAKTRALLAYLGMEGVQPRAKLMTLFWAEASEARARQNLRQTLYQLRQVTGVPSGIDDWLIADQDSLRLNENYLRPTDVEQFLQACRSNNSTAAIALYRGTFLESLNIDDSIEFQEWLLTQREYLQRLALQMMYHATEQALQNGEYNRAIELAQRQIKLESWREEAHLQVMRAFALQGNPNEALAQYRRLKRTLKKELGISPTLKALALYEDLRAERFTATPMLPPPGNLPAPVTPFIGRESEQAALHERLKNPTCRLLTVYGLGGMGKTHLALEVARQAAAQRTFADGVWLVALEQYQLTPEAQPEIAEKTLLTGITAALGLPILDAPLLETQLTHFLANKHLLLLLDNCEHLLNGSPALSRLLQHAPKLSLLATSREPLNLHEEWLLPLYGLPIPQEVETLLQNESVHLFLQRARQSAPEFALTPANRAQILGVCRAAEGLPLALELTAAWLRELTPAEILGQIQNGLHVFTSPWRNAPPRQSSLTAIFEQTWQRLNQAQQRALMLLSIFHGDYSSEAAYFVAQTTALDLALLSGRALLHRNPNSRYAMHELLRQFAGEKRTQDPAQDQVARARHSEWYLTHAIARRKNAPNNLPDPGSNIQFAWQNALQHANLPLLLQSLQSVFYFFFNAGRLQELTTLLELIPTHFETNPQWQHAPHGAPLLGQALALLADVYYHRYRYAEGKQTAERALQIARQHNIPALHTQALNALGLNQVAENPHTALTNFEQALAICQTLNTPLLLAQCYSGLAYANNYLNCPQAEQAYHQQAIQIYRQLNQTTLLATELSNLGKAYYKTGAFEQAHATLQQALTLAQQINDPRNQAFTLSNLGMVADYQARYTAAQTYYHQAIQIAEQIGYEQIVWAASANLSASLAYIGAYAAALEQAQRALQACLSEEKRHHRASLLMMMAFYYYYLQEYALAQTHAQAAIALATEVVSPTTEGYAQDVLGHVALAQGDTRSARAAYQRALVCKHSLNNPAVLLETQAGLAQADLLDGAPAAALARLEESLPALLARPPEGMEDPFAVYAVTHRVLLALGDARAAAVYQCARQFLAERAARLESQPQRVTFLNAIASHRYFGAAEL